MRRLKEYRELLLIDKHELDEMCMKQSQYFYEVSAEYIKALNEKDRLKEQVALVDAEIGIKLRKESEDRGDKPKMTEGKLGQLITKSTEHQEIYEEYLEAMKDTKMWEALKDAFSQRASMLKYMCELYISNYYSSTSVKPKGSRIHKEGVSDQ